MKSAAFVKKQLKDCQIFFLKKISGRKSADFLVKSKDAAMAVEVKQKFEQNRRESVLSDFLEGVNALCSSHSYDIHLKLKDSALKKNEETLNTIFSNLSIQLNSLMHAGIWVEEKEDEYFKWHLSKRFTDANSIYRSSFSRRMYPYVSYWKNDFPILDEAYQQILSTSQCFSDVTSGCIVLDLAGLSFDVRDAIQEVTSWKNKKKRSLPIIVLFLRHSGIFGKNRIDFTNDFYKCPS